MFCVAHIGESAHAVLRRETRGVVEIVFERCAYIRFNDKYLCIALASIGCGPLNLVYEQGVRQLPKDLQPGVVVSFSRFDKSLNIPGRYKHSIALLARAVISNSAIAAFTGRAYTVSVNRQQLHDVNRQQLLELTRPSAGLLDVVIAPGHKRSGLLEESLVRFTAPILQQLTLWLQYATRSDRPPEAPDSRIRSLLGAGPGLTPSGDDLLAGVLLTLFYCGHQATAEQLSARLLPVAAERTNAISASMLQEAALGRAGEFALAVLVMYGSADKFDSAVMSSTLRRMGESSGWDFLAGIVLVFDALANPATNGKLVYG